ncbi:hypothetical protein NN3_11480 [Nocardia neocaledoniensis NBRC 108232]|nr:hypothetical protein NN3_11480 [Nocardia neocaledoniensis NBRC 108232]
MRLVLGEDAQTQIAGVDEIAEDEIDQPVRAAEGHRGLGTVCGERKQSFALATGEHDPEYVRLAPHPAQSTGWAAQRWLMSTRGSNLDQ